MARKDGYLEEKDWSGKLDHHSPYVRLDCRNQSKNLRLPAL